MVNQPLLHMINFFRKTRKKLADDNKFWQYSRYAIGEIVLVVIGILIALSVNNWNENGKNKQKETYHLVNLLQELKMDSLRLHILKKNFETAVLSKQRFQAIFDGNSNASDSLGIYYLKMVDFNNDFVPNSTTMDELKNSGNPNLISNIELRRNIVKLSNLYYDLLLKLQFGSKKGEKLFDFMSQNISNMNKPTDKEILALIDLPYFTNQVRYNYLYTQLITTEIAYNGCLETMAMIKKELNIQ